MAESLAFIGDIHGDSARLTNLLRKLDGRRLVFLGDYVDHGPNSLEVLETLTELRNNEHTPVFLAGNHELGLLAFISGKLSFLEYAWMGGLATIRSYAGKTNDDVRTEFANAVPSTHFEFLTSCRPFFETDDIIASHAGINPDIPSSRDLSEIVLGRHPSLFQDDTRLDKLVICGHYLQNALKPHLGNQVVCLNTGCGTIGGPLTALLYPEMEFLQA